MHDCTTVPNVFGVASSHSVDTDCDLKICSSKNANLPIEQLSEQKQQQQTKQTQKQQSNGNIRGQQQSLVKSSIFLQTTTTPTILNQIALTTNSSLATTTQSILSSTIIKTSVAPQQKPTQQEEKTIKNDFDLIMQNHNSLQQQQHHHKLTTHAAIERPQCLPSTAGAAAAAYTIQQSPHATMARNTSTLSLVTGNNTTITDVDTSKQQKEQQQHQQFKQKQQHHKSANNSNINSNNHNQSNNHSNSSDPTMLGVINTISGSIPATGYTIDSLTATKTNLNGGEANIIGHCTYAMAEDLNVDMNNSCTNLGKLNGVQQQQKNHFRIQQQQQQQQQSTHQHHELKQTAAMKEFTNTYRRQYACSSFERNSNGYLWIITPVAASISVAIVIAALAGPQWLFTEEKLPNTLYNGTANFNVLDDGAFITRYTKSSLWIICTTLQGVETYSCIKIDYFSEKGYQPDPHDSASAIPYTVTKSCPFFLASGIVLLLSFIVFLIPTCSHQNNLYYFSAGIMFIVSGLLMLIGLIAYISILKAEIGSKLRPRSTLQPPLFKVTYGQSFFLFVFGFIATEFVGLLNIFLYISLQEVGYYSHLPCFTISNLQEKIKEGENRFSSHTYKSYKHEIESKRPLERVRKQQNKKHQVTAQELELNTKKLLKTVAQGNGNTKAGLKPGTTRRVIDAVTDANAGPYACRKHPNGMNSTTFLNEMDRRYYFEKPTTSAARSKCNLHTRNLAKSLNELYTESSSSSSALLLPPPPPSAMRTGDGGGLQLQTKTLPRPPQQFSDSPQDFPLTRSVSTTTDIYATQNVRAASTDCGNNNNSNRRHNMATNTRYNTNTQTQITDGSDGICNTKALLQQRNNNNPHTKRNLMQQLQQQQQQQQQTKRHKNIYQTTNFTATTMTSDNGNDLVGDTIDNRNHRLCRDGRNNDDEDNEEHNNNDNKTNDDNDDDDDDEEQPQKLCGLRRSIRKTKDELFEEFCKRAGVRPKPKNIYYIDNQEGEDDDDDDDVDADDNLSQQQSAHIEQEMQLLRLNTTRTNNSHQRRNDAPGHHLKQQQQHQKHNKQQQHTGDYRGIMENNNLFGDTIAAGDMEEDEDADADEGVDVDGDESGFKKLTENEEQLYVIDDNIHLMPQPIRSGRRASMYVEPNHLRRLNSNLSLHAIYAPAAARVGLQKSLYDLDTRGSEFGFLATAVQQQQQQHQPQQNHYTMRNNTYGGSQQRLQHDYHNQAMYQSRTLPRTFLKRNADSQDSVASAAQLHNMYSVSQQRLTTLMMQHQQQLQQQNHYLSMSREQELYNSRYGLNKSNEELNRQYMQQQPIYIQTHQLQQYQQQQPTSVACANYSTISSLKQPPLVQWPAAIPSSPSNFSGSFRLYGPAINSTTQNTNNNNTHNLLTHSNSNSGVTTITAGDQQHVANGTLNGSQASTKFQRAYAFDEQRRPSAILTDAFDLDEIEREHRRAHASLFTVNSNITGMGGGTVGGIVGNSKTQDHYDMINGTAV